MKTKAEGNPVGPDERFPETAWIWPDRKVLPYHYPHPVNPSALTRLIVGHR